ncbi:MAG: 50S ribosomal protein L4 [Patescibacteria group bacterium]
MLKVKVYNTKGEIVKTKELNPKIFAVEIKQEVIHRVLEAQLANQRKPWAATKDRSEVRGGGKKPWRQKGTGRARAGSIRSPIWRGGGVTFGPQKNRSYFKKINKKEKRKTLFMVLASKVKENHLILVDNLKIEKIRTKDFINILKELPCKGKKVLILYEKPEEKLLKSARNIENIKTLPANSLNIFDILKYDWLLMPLKALEIIEKTYLKSQNI